MKKVLGSFLILVLFTGCNEYTTRVCDGGYRADVPGLEGLKILAMQDGNTMEVTNYGANIEHIGSGEYRVESAVFRTCHFGGTVVFEGFLTNSAGHFEIAILERTASGFYFSGTAFDAKELSAKGIPYKLEKRNSSFELLPRFHTNIFEGQNVIVVDNANIPVNDFLGLVHPTSLTVKMYNQHKKVP